MENGSGTSEMYVIDRRPHTKVVAQRVRAGAFLMTLGAGAMAYGAAQVAALL